MLAGTYEFYIKDKNDCQTPSQSVVIAQPDVITTSHSIINASCYDSTGSLTINTINGGTSPYDVDYNNINPLEVLAGQYEYTITDFNACDYSFEYEVQQPSPLSYDFTSSEILCYDEQSELAISPSGGTGDIITEINSVVSTLSQLYAGTHSIRLTDGNNCVLEDSIQINPAELLTLELNKVDNSCNGQSLGYIDANVSGHNTIQLPME